MLSMRAGVGGPVRAAEPPADKQQVPTGLHIPANAQPNDPRGLTCAFSLEPSGGIEPLSMDTPLVTR
jgi:hypothetical protein